MLIKHFGPELDTKEGLEKLYNTIGPKEILLKYNIRGTLLYRRLKMFQIPIKLKPYQLITKIQLEEEYFSNKKSITQIAKVFNVTPKTIGALFKKHNIKGRCFREASKIRSKEISEQMKKLWSNPSYVRKMSNGYTSIKEKMAFLSQNQLGKISSIQKILYSILDDLQIKYEKEKTIGFWTYDCYLTDYNIIIECQGDYWHNLKKAQINDTAKATYLNKYFPHLRVKHIWEHEFMFKNRIIELIKYWTNKKDHEQIDFSFKSITINKISDEQAKLFIAKYHYFGRIGKCSIKYGAFLNNNMIGICAFASITRNESATRLGLKSNQIRELTRFCVHPQYQKRNLASWFLSKCIILIKNEIPNLKSLISFSDKTYNHYGTIYKATNWILDGQIKPDYWYQDKHGYIMHKKTLWDHASKMGIKEKEYSEQHGFIQVWGKEKNRFIYKFW